MRAEATNAARVAAMSAGPEAPAASNAAEALMVMNSVAAARPAAGVTGEASAAKQNRSRLPALAMSWQEQRAGSRFHTSWFEDLGGSGLDHNYSRVNALRARAAGRERRVRIERSERPMVEQLAARLQRFQIVPHGIAG
jgi:hypothetical protein